MMKRILDEIAYYCMDHVWAEWLVRIISFALGILLGNAMIAAIKFLSAV